MKSLKPARNDTTSSDELIDLDLETLLASCLHDIKNALGLLLGNLEQLQTNGTGSAPAGTSLSRLRLHGEQIRLNLVQLLALYRLRSEDQLVDVQEHNLLDFIEECIAPFEECFAEKGIAISIECDETAHWYFDADLIGAVVANALHNLYHQARTRVCFKVETDRHGLKLSVIDDGAGFPDTVLNDAAAHRGRIQFHSGSTGLGLYFSQMIARAHRNRGECGWIRLDNQGIEHGARFVLYLP